MLLFMGTNYGTMNLSQEELQTKLSKWWEWQEDMEKKGVLKGGNALQAPVRRIHGEDRVITDTISTELKEVVGGYFVVSVESIEQASEIAQGYPDYDTGGTVEIREVMVYNQ